MSKYPYLSNEVDTDKIDYSCINYNDNKQFCYITYGEQNEQLFIQTPLLRFIHPVVSQNIGGKTYNEIYLFLTPHDTTTPEFIELITNIETKSVNYITELTDKQLTLIPLIKTSDIENITDMRTKQVIKYLKIKLLDQTKIEYNKKIITIDDLNKLSGKVNLKMIFEISMIWLNQIKIGIYLKPIKIRAIDIVNEPNLDFRDEDDIPQNDINLTEGDNFKHIFNNQSLMSLNESAFNREKETQMLPPKPKQSNPISDVKLNAFLPSTGMDDEPHIDLQKKLKQELFDMDNKHDSQDIKNDNHVISDDSDDSKTSSSVRIEKLARKNKKSNNSKNKKEKEKDKDEIKKSISKLNQLLSDDNEISDESDLDINFGKS